MHTYTHRSADPILGIRVGVDACGFANGWSEYFGRVAPSLSLAPRGQVMQTAVKLALATPLRPAYRTGRAVKDETRIKPRVTLENVLDAITYTVEASNGGVSDETKAEILQHLRSCAPTAESNGLRRAMEDARYSGNKAAREAHKAAAKARR